MGKQPWNVFDFVVVVMSILGLALADFIEKYFVSPTLLRVARVVRVGRVLRLVKGAKGIRTLLFALAVSLPALFNICLLLFLVMFIYAIFGMSFFMNVKYGGGIDAEFNFETFGRSMIILFQMSTSAGWDGVLAPLMNDHDCNCTTTKWKPTGNCGNSAIAVVYLITYLVMTFLIVVNMYIAVILENFSQATEEVQEGLTDDDYDMYYEIWQLFDPKGTQYIRLDQLSDLLDRLEEPLQYVKPNKFIIVKLNIPICEGDMIYCVDILDALTKAFFAAKKGDDGGDEEEEEELDIDVAPKIEDYKPISSTLKRQREIWCAYVIQRSYRRYRELRGPLDEVEGGDDDDVDGGNNNNNNRRRRRRRRRDDNNDDDDDGGHGDDDNTSGDVSKEAVEEDEETVDSGQQPSDHNNAHHPATSPNTRQRNNKDALGDTSTGDASN